MKTSITNSPYSFTGDKIEGKGLNVGKRFLRDLDAIFADCEALRKQAFIRFQQLIFTLE